MKSNHKGYSLIELVVVVAILSIIFVIVGAGIGSVQGARASSCAKKLLSAMEETKTNSLGFDEVKLKLYKKTDGYYIAISQYKYVFAGDGTKSLVEDTNATIERKIGDKDLNISAKMSAMAGSEVSYNVTVNDIIISFDRSSGAFNPVGVYSAGGATPVDTTSYIDSIIIKQGTAGREMTIKCIKLTGKFYMD